MYVIILDICYFIFKFKGNIYIMVFFYLIEVKLM